MRRGLTIPALLLLTTGMARAGLTPLRVDINPDNGRGDIRTIDADNWAFQPGNPTHAVGPVSVTLRAARPLEVRWFKPLLVHGATLTSDGVAAPGRMELVINGLPPGRHSLATFHNRLTETPAGPCSVSVVGEPNRSRVEPTHKVHDDADAGAGFVEFTVADRPIVVAIESLDGPDREVILNGFEIDHPDPNRRAIKPAPADRDEHADADSEPGKLNLRWTNRVAPESHDVYLGTSAELVAAAGRNSPEFLGNQTNSSRVVEGLTSKPDYFWRVDAVDAAGSVTRGEVWHFRARHLAFPGAEGFGRFAQGGRGGRVIEVTNRDDHGPGSLRAAVEAAGPRTVVFRVGGVIALNSPLTVVEPRLTIAGQTAPGDGICLRGHPFGTATSTRDVIVRHLRVRVGDEAKRSYDGMGLGSAHSIFDHCSISWSIDEGLDSRTARDSTFQRCIISESLDDSFQRHPHSFAASIGGDRASYLHNLLAHNAGRNWSLAGGYDNAVRFAGHFEICNNVVYNWKHRTTDGGAKEVDFLGNYYKPGPATQLFQLMKPDVGSAADRQTYHVAGNIFEGRPEFNADNWAGIKLATPGPINEVRSDVRLLRGGATNVTSAEAAYDDVLNDVGATLPRQDAIDARVIREVRTGTFEFKGSKGKLPGIIDTPTDLGPDPWGIYRAVEVAADFDSDHDGLPDAWEKAHGTNPNSPPGDFSDSNADPDGDGYTNLEDYLNQPRAGS